MSQPDETESECGCCNARDYVAVVYRIVYESNADAEEFLRSIWEGTPNW